MKTDEIASLLSAVKAERDAPDAAEVPITLTGARQEDPTDPNASLFEVAGGLGALEGMDSLPPDLLAALTAAAAAEQRGSGAERESTRPTDDGGIDIKPKPSFVVKTSDETGRKVFVNVCGHPFVPLPGHWNEVDGGLVPEEVEKAIAAAADEGGAGAEALRFPVSLGEARNDLDKKGLPCTVYDVVLNQEVIAAAGESRCAI